LPPFVSFWDDDGVDDDGGSGGTPLTVVVRTTGMVLVDGWFMMLTRLLLQNLWERITNRISRTTIALRTG
jgi:hypothetical protein